MKQTTVYVLELSFLKPVKLCKKQPPTIIYQGVKVIGRTIPEDGPLLPMVEKPSVETRIEETDFTTEYRG